MSDSEAIRRFQDEQHGYGARYREALARRLGFDAHEAAALLHMALVGRLTAEQLSLGLVLPAEETAALIERLISRGHVVRSARDEFGVALPTLERLAEITRPLVRDLDALAAQLSEHDRAVIGRFLEAVVEIDERYADELARRAIERPASPPD
jgi:hypothetical protein